MRILVFLFFLSSSFSFANRVVPPEREIINFSVSSLQDHGIGFDASKFNLLEGNKEELHSFNFVIPPNKDGLKLEFAYVELFQNGIHITSYLEQFGKNKAGNDSVSFSLNMSVVTDFKLTLTYVVNSSNVKDYVINIGQNDL